MGPDRTGAWLVAAAASAALLASACVEKTVGEKFTVTVEPLQAKQGEEVTLIIRGEDTDFEKNAPRVSFIEGAEGLTLGEVHVDDQARARVRLTISSDADPEEKHTLQVIVLDRGFRFDFRIAETVLQKWVYFDPDTMYAGDSVAITLIGENTHFVQGRTEINFPEEALISTGDVTVHSPTSARVSLDVDADSPPGVYAATVTTGTETVGSALTVLSPEFPILRVSPDSITQGTSQNITLTVENMEIVEGDLTVECRFNTHLDVDEVQRVSSSMATARITADEDAPIGRTPIWLSSGPDTAYSQIRVLPSSTSDLFILLHPSILSRGAQNVELQIVGYGTHFEPGVTTIDFTPDQGLDWGDLTVLDPGLTRAVVEVDVSGEAELGTRDVTVTTDDETARGSITIAEASFPYVNVAPSALTQGDRDVTLTLEASGIAFTDGSVDVAFLPLSGVVITSDLTIETDGKRAAITVDVTDSAPTGSTLLAVTIGTRTLYAPVIVNPASGNASFTLDPPYGSVPSSEVTLAITGMNTSWDPGSESMDMSDPSIEVVSFEVLSGTSAEAVLSIPPWVDARRTVLYMHGSDRIEAAWLSLITRPAREVTLSTWSGDEVRVGEAGQSVFVEGHGTGFINGLTRAEIHYGSDADSMDVGEGIRVDGISVADSDLAILQLSVYSTSVPGSAGVLLATGAEEGFASLEILEDSMERSVEIEPGCLVAGTPAEVAVTGQNMEFRTGATVVRPASSMIGGLAIPESSVSVRDADSLTANVTADALLENSIVPVVVKTDVVVSGAGLSVRAADGAPWPSLLTWALRKGEPAAVSILGMEGMDFAAHPPIVEADEESAEISGVTVESDRVDFQLLVPVGVEGNLVWLTLRSDDDAYTWRVALYAFSAVHRAAIGSPAMPFLAGTQAMQSQVDLSGLSLPADAYPSVVSVSGAAFVESARLLDPVSVEAVFDLAVSSASFETEAFLPLTGISDGALPLDLQVEQADTTTLRIGSEISGTVPSDLPRFVEFEAYARALVSLVPEDGAERIGFHLIHKSTSTLGIERASNRPVTHFMLDSNALHNANGYYVAIGSEADFGKGFTMAIKQTPWKVGEIGEGEPDDDTRHAFGIRTGGAGSLIYGGHRHDRQTVDTDFYSTGMDPLAPGMCAEAVSTAMAPSLFAYPFLSMELLDAAGATVQSMTGNVMGEGMDPMLCADPRDSEVYYVRIDGHAGTEGPYMLFLRPEVVVNELRLNDSQLSFVELHCGNASGCRDYVLEIYDMTLSVPSRVETMTIDAFPPDGIFVLAAGDRVENYDALSPVMAALPMRVSFKVCDESGTVCDAVQVGGTARPDFVEGDEVLDPWASDAWQRLWHVDTDMNVEDFVECRCSTPGLPNYL